MLQKQNAKGWMEKQQHKDLKIKNYLYQANDREILEDFEMLQMKEGESINSYFAQNLKIAKSMKAVGENMQDKFNYVVCSIEDPTIWIL